MKANSLTDKDVIEKISEASNAGVQVTLFIRGICCLVPRVKGSTDNVQVVSIIGRLLEHSRIYCFGSGENCSVYLSSADLMTRNLNKRIEIAWPVLNPELRQRILMYLDICLHDTAKLREMRRNATYTPLGAFVDLDEDENALETFDAQNALIQQAADAAQQVEEELNLSAREDSYDDEFPQASNDSLSDLSADAGPAETLEPVDPAERMSELIDQFGSQPETPVESAIDRLTDMRIDEIIELGNPIAPDTDPTSSQAELETPLETSTPSQLEQATTQFEVSTPQPQAEQSQSQAETPQAEAPQAQAPQAEAPQAEAPQAEAPSQQAEPARRKRRGILAWFK